MPSEETFLKEQVLRDVFQLLRQARTASDALHRIDQRRTRGALRLRVREGRAVARALQAALEETVDSLQRPTRIETLRSTSRQRAMGRRVVSEAEAINDLIGFLLDNYPHLLELVSKPEASADEPR